MTRLARLFENSTIELVQSPKWVRCVFAGVTIADSKRAVLLRSQGKRRGTPVYYFPKADVRTDLLRPNDVTTTDAQLGPATRYDIVAGDRVAADAAFSY